MAFLKPAEPAFIARMKEQAGYKEGPSVDTKREALAFDDEDSDDHDDEQPQVVVLNEGDLTAEEVSKAIQEKEEGPADLSQRVVFCKPEKAKKNSQEPTEVPQENSKEAKKSKAEGKPDKLKNKSKSEVSKKVKSKSVLSFNEDDEIEDS